LKRSPAPTPPKAPRAPLAPRGLLTNEQYVPRPHPGPPVSQVRCRRWRPCQGRGKAPGEVQGRVVVQSAVSAALSVIAAYMAILRKPGPCWHHLVSGIPRGQRLRPGVWWFQGRLRSSLWCWCRALLRVCQWWIRCARRSNVCPQGSVHRTGLRQRHHHCVWPTDQCGRLRADGTLPQGQVVQGQPTARCPPPFC
jgi:hypothetical protein